MALGARGTQVVDCVIPIPGARLWSPEDPFLYRLEVSSGSDTLATRFGMRSFQLKPGTEPGGGRAYLNGKMYYLRGNNITIYRFFEDPLRGALPWDKDWVRTLHQRCKQMHWNALRTASVFRPNRGMTSRTRREFSFRTNSPFGTARASFGGPDAPATGGRIHRVDARAMEPSVRRHLGRPERIAEHAGNQPGHQPRPQTGPFRPPLGQRLDAAASIGRQLRIASLPVHAPGFDISLIPGVSPLPGGPQPNTGHNAIIINEYGWLWLNRDGSPTTLTVPQYQHFLSPQATADERREFYARMVAMLTEFSASHRQCAGVLHFCTLGYSRPIGQTSDNWIDVKHLIFEPHFAQYVGDAFAPVGLMIDHWATELSPGEARQAPVVVVNDLYDPWKGQVRLRLAHEGKVLWEEVKPLEVEPLGRATLPFTFTARRSGAYQLEAALLGAADAKPVCSHHDFSIISDETRRARLGIAVGKPVKASSNLIRHGTTSPEAAVDGRLDTRWSSEFGRDPQWLAVDLGAVTSISRVEIVWQGAFATSYAIEVSLDGEKSDQVYATTQGAGGTEVARFKPVDARWVRHAGKATRQPSSATRSGR